MDGRKIVESLLGVGGIWLLAKQLPDYATTLTATLSGRFSVSASPPTALLFQSVHFAVSFMAGGVLLLARKPIARWLHPEAGSAPTPGESVFAAGVGLLAIYFVVFGLLELGPFVWADMRFQERPDVMLRGSFSVALGVALFIASPWILCLWKAVFRGARRVV